MIDYSVPGVYRQDVFARPPSSLLTGVPVFLGQAVQGEVDSPLRLTLWPEFEAEFGPVQGDRYLAHAVRGFFENGGLVCHVVRLEDDAPPVAALRRGLAAARGLDEVDIVCAPDAVRRRGDGSDADYVAGAVALQTEILADCRHTTGRFAILDGVITSQTPLLELQRAGLAADDGAIYHPWLLVSGPGGEPRYVPPCGHVAGMYSRSDQRVGVHKAPANEAVDGILDLRVNLTDAALGGLYSRAVNCLQAVPGRGIRVRGSRTLSDDPAWRQVSSRRVFLTMSRWVERFMTDLVHEPNDVRLWVRIMRELTAHLDDLFQRGALKGRTPDEAFFVKCDSETNPPEVVDAGRVVTQVGLALTAPAEFVVVTVIHGASGVSVSSRPAPAESTVA
jgi:Bacteriophage tail sheath protein